MPWVQDFDPLKNIFLSALVATIPVAFIFWALIIRKMKGYMASLLTTLFAVLIAILVYDMPVKLAVLSTTDGALFGLFTICWIILGAMFLYNVTVISGQFEIIKDFMASVTSDRRLQALLIAFSFGAFLEGSAGFGAPVAITAAMLAGLGFNPLYAAGLCLISNTAPVAFGSIGIPITVASQVSGLPEMAVSQMVGRTLPVISVFVPFYLVFIMAGLKKTMEVLPAILVSGIVFASMQFITSNYISPMLPDVISSLMSIVCLIVLIKFWKPKSVWHFKEEPIQATNFHLKHSTGQVIKAWSPFLIMTVLIVAWGLQPVKDFLNSTGQIKFYLPGLQDAISRPNGTMVTIKPFTFNYLSNTGTAVFIATFISLPLIGMNIRSAFNALLLTLRQLKFPIITIAAILGFAYIVNNSGMSNTMALALASTGILFPFFSPVLGWLGVFLTGSDTSSNALFGKLQYSSAKEIGVDPLITVSANATGGVTGKMVSPQSIAVGAAAVGLTGKESGLFRFTVKHSFIMLFLICILTVLQAYVVPWIVPSYLIAEDTSLVKSADTTAGPFWLIVSGAIILFLVLAVFYLNRNKSPKPINKG